MNHKKIIQWVKLTKIHSAAYVEVSCLMPTGAGLSRSPASVKQKLLSAVMINTSGSPPLPVTPKEYYRDYPDTVSIRFRFMDCTNILEIFIYLSCSTMTDFHPDNWVSQYNSVEMKFSVAKYNNTTYIIYHLKWYQVPRPPCYCSLIEEYESVLICNF